MKALIYTALAACGLGCLPALATAQPYYQPRQQYPYSPAVPSYINMVNGNPAVSYFGIVQPQLAMQGALSQLQQQAVTDQQMMSSMQNLPLTTGHSVRFLSVSPYFNRLPVAVPGGAGGAAGVAAGGLYAPPTLGGMTAGGRVGSPYTTPNLTGGYR